MNKLEIIAKKYLSVRSLKICTTRFELLNTLIQYMFLHEINNEDSTYIRELLIELLEYKIKLGSFIEND